MLMTLACANAPAVNRLFAVDTSTQGIGSYVQSCVACRYVVLFRTRQKGTKKTIASPFLEMTC